MAVNVDARGLSCPQPIMMTKKAIDEGNEEIEVLVDDAVAKENVTRLAESSGFKIDIEELENSELKLKLKK